MDLSLGCITDFWFITLTATVNPKTLQTPFTNTAFQRLYFSAAFFE
jgi:hypothetical protein